MSKLQTEKSTLLRRQKQAQILDKKITTILKNIKKVPSYTGKARFMDLIIDGQRQAHLLADNLKLDVAYWKE